MLGRLEIRYEASILSRGFFRRWAFPRELWPSQRRICAAGVLRGESAIIQMPNDEEAVIDGAGLMPTARRVAFASWQTPLGRLEYVSPLDPDDPEFFVPRVIDRVSLRLQPRERTPRYFPQLDDGTSVGLYRAPTARRILSACYAALARGHLPCHLLYFVTLSAAARLAIALVVRAYFEKGAFMPIAALDASLFPRATAAGSIDTFLDQPSPVGTIPGCDKRP
jgi:hypothetical protein